MPARDGRLRRVQDVPEQGQVVLVEVQTREVLTKFLYRAGTNVALHSAERSETYRKTRAKIARALAQSVKPFASEAAVERVLKDHKAVESLKFDLDLKAFLVWGGNRGGQAALERIVRATKKIAKRAVPNFNLLDPKILGHFSDRAVWARDEIASTSKEWVVTQCELGYREGLTAKEIAGMILEKIPDMASYRAEAAAHYELANAIGTVAMETYRNNSIERKSWQTSMDDRVDEECEANAEQGPIALDEQFASGVDQEPSHFG